MLSPENYSSETQEIIGKEPSWVIRYGTIILWSCLIILIFISAKLNYIESVKGILVDPTMTNKAMINIPAITTVKEWTCVDKDTVQKGQILAVLNNSANTEDVLLLKEVLNTIRSKKNIEFDTLQLPRRLNLGELQPMYTQVLNLLILLKQHSLIKLNKVFLNILRESLANLSTAVMNWEQKYLVRSKIAGVVHMLHNYEENNHIDPSFKPVAFISPVINENKGLGLFKSDAFSKIQTGQEIFIVSSGMQKSLIKGKVYKIYDPMANGDFYVSYIITSQEKATVKFTAGIISVVTNNQTVLNKLLGIGNK